MSYNQRELRDISKDYTHYGRNRNFSINFSKRKSKRAIEDYSQRQRNSPDYSRKKRHIVEGKEDFTRVLTDRDNLIHNLETTPRMRSRNVSSRSGFNRQFVSPSNEENEENLNNLNNQKISKYTPSKIKFKPSQAFTPTQYRNYTHRGKSSQGNYGNPQLTSRGSSFRNEVSSALQYGINNEPKRKSSVAERIDRLIEHSRAVRRGRITPTMERKYGDISHRPKRDIVKSPTIPKLLDASPPPYSNIKARNHEKSKFDIDESRGYPVRSTLKKSFGDRRAQYYDGSGRKKPRMVR